MRTAIFAGTILVLTPSVVFSQGRSAEPKPAIGVGSKSMDTCSAVQRKFCATTASGVMKECLVTNWNHLTSDCQDALGTPVDRIGGNGRRQSD